MSMGQGFYVDLYVHMISLKLGIYILIGLSLNGICQWYSEWYYGYCSVVSEWYVTEWYSE